MPRITFVMRETTYGEISVDLPENYTEEDLEEARSTAYSDCEWDGKMEVEMVSEKIENE